ncbi:hypothetical protein KEM48_002738 [Puccinia striiformis f. sp. tritici PST-130]|nr:hypothetical protein KEM48_002738 [Puccinia striiformis f. sp. tritici PST-130]
MRYSTPVPLRPVEYKDSEEREEDDRLDELDELDKLHGPSSPGLFSGTSLPNSRLSIFHSSATQYDSSPNQADYDQDYKNSLEDSQTLHPIHLEGGQEPSPLKPRRTQSLQYKPPAHTKRVLFFGTSALIGLAYLIVFLLPKDPLRLNRKGILFVRFYGLSLGHSVKINVILMISDGFGPASESFARGFVQHLQNLTVEEQAKFSRWTFRKLRPILNNHQSKDLLDHQKINLALYPWIHSWSVVQECDCCRARGTEPCGTVLEAAKHRGYLTGLVATSRITHATPASFYAHVIDRDMESKIATFLTGEGPLGRNVDLAFGGGRRFFLPSSSLTSSRSDDNDLLGTAQSKYGFTIINSTDAFEKAWDPRSSKGHFKTPSLAALQTLSREAKDKSAHGFFLMIEGSRIDMAAHSNDPVATCTIF